MKTTFPRRFNSQPPKIKIGLVVCCLLLCATFFAIIFPPQTMSSVSQFSIQDRGQLPPVEPGTTVVQTFKATDDFSGFGLLFANYDQLIDQGTVEIKIMNQKEQIDTCSMEARNLMDLSFFYCDTSLTNGQLYDLLISVENITSPITFLTTTAPIDGATLTINKKPQDQLIIMDFTKQRKNYMLAWAFAMLAALTFCYLAANMKRESHGSKKS